MFSNEKQPLLVCCLLSWFPLVMMVWFDGFGLIRFLHERLSCVKADESGSGQPEGVDMVVCRAPGGELYVEGETWSLDECTRCTCRHGRVLCDSEVCPPVLCHRPIKIKDSCCYVCPGTTHLHQTLYNIIDIYMTWFQNFLSVVCFLSHVFFMRREREFWVLLTWLCKNALSYSVTRNNKPAAVMWTRGRKHVWRFPRVSSLNQTGIISMIFLSPVAECRCDDDELWATVWHVFKTSLSLYLSFAHRGRAQPAASCQQQPTGILRFHERRAPIGWRFVEI